MPDSTSRTRRVLGLSRFAWLCIGGAFVVGLLLFALIWVKQRSDDDFFRADGARRDSTGSTFDPLPAPGADIAGDRQPQAANAQGAGKSPAAAQVGIDESLPTFDPAVQPATVEDGTLPAEPAQQSAPVAADGPPVPLSRTMPDYPPSALRRGISGEVLLRANVDSGGVPYAIDLISGSGSRELDRAASDAVRRWRFQPAMRDGQPVNGSIQIPIVFEPGH